MNASGSSFDFDVDGHSARFITSGDERQAAILDIIGGAEASLRLLFYDFADDDHGTPIRDALVAAAQRGVKVNILLDGFGLIDLDEDEFFKPLEDAGGSTCVFHARPGRRFFLRNHQKLCVADERRFIIGGANLARDYLRDGEGCWRDLWVRMDGPQAAPLAAYYDAVDEWVKKKRPSIRSLSDVVAEHSQVEGPLQWSFSAPWPRHTPWPSTFIRDCWHAERIDMIAAYFSPARAMLRRISRVARRGGRVRLVTPAKSDNAATIAAARHRFGGLLKKGVEIFEYQPCKLHTKLVVIDDIVYVGSSNFDFRSLFLNMEMMLRIDSKPFADQVRQYIDHEIADSEAITPAVHKARATPWRRVVWAVSSFLTTTMDYTISRRLNFPLGEN